MSEPPTSGAPPPPTRSDAAARPYSDSFSTMTEHTPDTDDEQQPDRGDRSTLSLGEVTVPLDPARTTMYDSLVDEVGDPYLLDTLLVDLARDRFARTVRDALTALYDSEELPDPTPEQVERALSRRVDRVDRPTSARFHPDGTVDLVDPDPEPADAVEGRCAVSVSGPVDNDDDRNGGDS